MGSLRLQRCSKSCQSPSCPLEESRVLKNGPVLVLPLCSLWEVWSQKRGGSGLSGQQLGVSGSDAPLSKRAKKRIFVATTILQKS